MRIILPIFALLFLSCQEETFEGVEKCEVMVFSDALPVQWWLADCETYNEQQTETNGVHAACWCQPWLCDNAIITQFTHTSGVDFELQVFAGSGIEVNEQLTNDEFLSDLSGWSQTGSELFAWNSTFSGSAFLAIAIAATDYNNIFYQPLSQTYESGTTVRVVSEIFFENSTHVSSSVSIALVLLNNGVVVNTIRSFSLSSTSPNIDGTYSIDEDIQLTSDVDEVGIKVTQQGVNSTNQVDVYIKRIQLYTNDPYMVFSTPIDEISSGVYQFAYTPSENSPDFCDRLLQLKIVVDDVVVAKTDCLDIKESHMETVSFAYTNQRNFSGIVYENMSPDLTFNILVPCRFYHQKFPQQDEGIDLTTGIIITGSNKKKQRKLQVKHSPYYFHNKLIEILQHQTVTALSKTWKKQEAYEVLEGKETWPLKPATVFLTEDNSIIRNVV